MRTLPTGPSPFKCLGLTSCYSSAGGGPEVESLDLLHRYRDQPLALLDTVPVVLSDRLDIPVWTYSQHFNVPLDVARVTTWR